MRSCGWSPGPPLRTSLRAGVNTPQCPSSGSPASANDTAGSSPWTMCRSTSIAEEIFGLIGPNGAGKTTTMECVEGLRRPDRGTISVLSLDPVRDVYRLQDRIGVQLQEAQLQKRIKVWEAVDLWASLYRRAGGRSRSAARAARAGREARRLVHDAVGRPEAAAVHRARADQRSRSRVSRRADDRARSAGAARNLGAGPRHPNARQDGLPDHAPDGRGRAAVRSGRDHRSRPDRRYRHAGRA